MTFSLSLKITYFPTVLSRKKYSDDNKSRTDFRFLRTLAFLLLLFFFAFLLLYFLYLMLWNLATQVFYVNEANKIGFTLNDAQLLYFYWFYIE